MASAFLSDRHFREQSVRLALVRAFVAFGLVAGLGLPAPGAALIGVGSIDTPGEALDVEAAGGLAWVADGSGGLRVFEVSNPRNPVELGALDTPGSASAVEERNGIAYVADDSSGLRVIDVSEVSTPEELGALDTPGRALDVSVVDELAYVADGGSGLRVIGVSDPKSPVELGALDTPGVADGVAVVDTLAFVADGDSGLRIVDVSDAAAPFELGALDTPGFAKSSRWSVTSRTSPTARQACASSTCRIRGIPSNAGRGPPPTMPAESRSWAVWPSSRTSPSACA